MRRLIVVLTVVSVLVASLSFGAPARAGHNRGKDTFVGAGVALVSVPNPPKYPSQRTVPGFLSLQVADGGAYGLVCEFRDTWCSAGSWLTFLWFDCWKVVSRTSELDPLPGVSVFYGGVSLRTYPRNKWFAVKVVDAGPGGFDRVGFQLFDQRADDGYCGARKIQTGPLIAGDFQGVGSL